MQHPLGDRYPSREMQAIWDEEAIVQQERELWLAALEVFQELGASIPQDALAAYRYVCELRAVDLCSIAKIEAETKHDVMARKQEFDALASAYEGKTLSLAHSELTSRDPTENCEQLRVYESLLHVRDRSVAVMAQLRNRSKEWQSVIVGGRSHGQIGQVTTFGKRFATILEEFMHSYQHIEYVIENYVFRGFKGSMGTMQDLVTYLESPEKALQFEEKLAAKLGMNSVALSTGQVYPRSYDFEVVAVLNQLAAPLGNLSRLVRDTTRLRQLNEGFSKGQKGSSRMPHKKNPNKSERINGLRVDLQGFLTMAAANMGVQEFEGDVSCSVPRRTHLSDSFFAIDGILETALTVLRSMSLNPKVIAAELKGELPFLCTTAFRTALVEKGVDDTLAYSLIQKHASKASNTVNNGKPNDLLDRLAKDKQVRLSKRELNELCQPNYGDALGQVNRVCDEAGRIISTFGCSVTNYRPNTRN